MMTRPMAIVNSHGVFQHGCMETLGDIVRNYRAKAGISQVELARRTGIPQGTISRLETGAYKEVPPPNVLVALGREMDISELAMLRAYGYLHGIAAAVEPDTIALFDPLDREILEGLALLTEREKSHVLSMIQFFKGGIHGNTSSQPLAPRPVPGTEAGQRRTG